MSSTRRRTFAASIAVLGVLVSGAAIAWACTPQASIGIDVSTGNPGTQVQVTGAEFADGGPVQITWNGGQVLATATGPEFSVPITIPAAPAETHTIVAVGFEQNGRAVGRARASFTIPGVAPDAGPASGSPGGAGRSPGSSSGNASGGDAVAGGGNGATANGGRGTTVQAPGRSAPAETGEAPLPTADSVFADSTVSSQGRGDAAIRARGADSKASPSERSAAAGLWSGFTSGSTPSLGNVPDDVESGSVPGITLALLVLGLTAVMAGVGVGATRRRRATARSAGPADSD